MQRRTLGRSGIEVSSLCLGTMTWGRQTPEADAHDQIDRALDAGIDFLDTAEMYPVNPVREDTVGDTERVIGAWIARSGRRDDIVLATKISGLNSGFVRKGQKVTPATLTEALDQSLTRLRTDRIDLYQLHWPNRGSYHFRQLWGFDPTGQDPAEEIETIHALSDTLKGFVEAGKIRAFGLSNDSVWGLMQWLSAAEATGGPRIATIQNEYSLLCRQFDSDWAEAAANEEVTLFAYSPLAAGLLTGKYQDGAVPEGSRMAHNGNLGGRKTDRVFPAVEVYLDIARRHGLDPVHLALAWCRDRPVPTIPICGATTLEQLEVALGAIDVTLDKDVLAEIDAAHRAHPLPF